MPTFDFTAPDGKSYTVEGPEGATPAQAFQILQSQIGAAPAGPAPVSTNDVARAAATGVPIVGGALNKLDAATNAALAPVLNRFFAPENQLPEPSFSERYSHSLRDQEGADKRFAADHPVVDTAAQLAGGVASMVPVMSAAPAAFGLAGPMSTMIRNGAISGAAISGADAAVRGENPTSAAVTGGIIGGAAGPVGRGVGKVVSAIADRVRPAPVVAQNVERIAGVDVPLSQSQVTQNPALSAEEQIMLRGGRGEGAQQNAQGFADLQGERVGQARDAIAAGLDPTGAAARTAPQDAAERVAAELIAQEQARQAAERGVHAGPMSPVQQGEDMARAFGPAGSSNEHAERIAAELVAQEQARQAAEAANVAQVGQEGQSLARSIGGGQVRAATPFDAGELLSDRLAAARNAAKTDYRGKYAAADSAPGEFAPGSAAGFRGDVENALPSAAVSLDPTNTKLSLHALDVIDRHMNLAGPAAPKAAAALGPEHAQTVSDIRARFGDEVAAAYDRQKAATNAPTNITQNITVGAAAPKAQSLLEFIASKGGLGPDAELEAIGGHGHTVNVEGVGRRKLVRQGGWPLDYAREAAEEAGYLRGNHNGTSTVNDLLDAMDAEMRGQKRYPEGFEGHAGKREVSALSEREQFEQDRHLRGFEDDLAAAGHGELGPDVKARAVDLMSREGMDADSAVEHAFRQLEQEDNAVSHGAGFPGDRQPAPAAATAQAPGSGFTMRDVEQVRKQLSTLYGDARRAMLAGGSGSDVRALEVIRDQFDARVERMVSEGKFSGDGPAVLKMLQDARASFADYKQKFAKRGAGDTIGAAVEKILGKFSDTKATPDTIVNLAYGSASSPGGQMPVQIAQRIIKIFGRDSAEFGAYKQGLLAHLREGDPGKAAARINEFLTGNKRLLAQVVFTDAERAGLARYADRLRSTLPGEAGPTPSANKILRDLMGTSGTGTGVNAPETALELKKRLSPEGWNRVRAMAFRELTHGGDPAEIASRIESFLTGSNSKMLAQTFFSADDRASLARYADRLRSTLPREAENGTAAAAIRRYTGADGAPPASPHKIINDLMGASGKGDGVNAPLIAQGLKKQLSPEGFSQLKVMAFNKLTNAGEGKIAFEAQALSQRLYGYLNSPLSKVLNTPQELELIKKLASVYKQMIPVKGTTNPSGTAPMLAKMASGLRHTLLPLLGLTHGGLPGAGIAYAADKGLTAIGNANAARKATNLFYGPQAVRPVDPRFAKGLGLLGQGDTGERNQRRRVK